MLVVSRSDVQSDGITEFDPSTRFIKLPIAKYLEMRGEEPNSTQYAIINAINNPKYRFVSAAVSRRQGKTHIANIIANLVTLIPDCHVLIMSPNYNLSQISFDMQRKLLEKFGVKLVIDNAKDRILKLENGSTIRMGSVNQVDSCVGRSYDFIIFDEAALTSEGEEAFNVALRPTLDKPTAKAMFISTPRGKNNWFSTFFQRGFSDDYPMWCSIQADWRENPRITKSDIEEAQLVMSRAEFQQEYEASFNSFQGQIYTFNSEKCTFDMGNFDLPSMDVIAGIDIGFKDPTAIIVIGYSYDTELYYVLDEYLEAEKTSDHHAEVLQKFIADWDILACYIDSSAAQTRFDWAERYDISTNPANKSVLDGISWVQAIVENDRLMVNKHCIHTLAMLDQYRWSDKENLLTEKPVHDKFSHMADALRYALYTHKVSQSML